MAMATIRNAYKLMHDGAQAFARAERHGIRVDVEYCTKKKAHLTKRIARIEQELKDTKLYDLWGKVYGVKTNTSSNHQLSYILYTVMKVEPPKTTPSGQGATDEEALGSIGVPGLDRVLEIRKLRKMRDTYLGAFLREQRDGYVHPFFNLHLVRTYRSSSDHPNFQNIPRRDKEAMQICRRAILPRPGHRLLDADFAGVEVAIAATYHKDPQMLSYLRDPASDMHLDMAKIIFIHSSLNRRDPEHDVFRDATKNGFVFPQFYGDYYGHNALRMCQLVNLPTQGHWRRGQGSPLGRGTIGDHLITKGIKSFKQFVAHIKGVEEEFWTHRFPVYGEWRKKWVRQYERRGYMQMHTGFICKGALRKNEIINYPIQGAAFHCLLWTFIEVDKAIRLEGWDTKLLGQIHDNMLLDVAPGELQHVVKRVREIACVRLAEAWKWIIVPLSIDITLSPVDGSWAEKVDMMKRTKMRMKRTR